MKVFLFLFLFLFYFSIKIAIEVLFPAETLYVFMYIVANPMAAAVVCALHK
jgi:hypothetical protein